jgi:hypothetical protein
MGRKQDLIRTVNVRKDELYKYVTTSIIHSMLPITDDIYVLLISDNLNTGILNDLNVRLLRNSEYKSYHSIVRSNVAIASAVTAYARIHSQSQLGVRSRLNLTQIVITQILIQPFLKQSWILN